MHDGHFFLPGSGFSPGCRIVVRTPDRREYRGQYVETRSEATRTVAVVRLDTGWVTSFPEDMVHVV